jgi:hypothetical protein
MKFLTSDQAIDRLRMGRAIEQWLGHATFPTYRSIKWLRIDREVAGTFSLAIFEAFDDGNTSMLDIYSFEPVDPDLPNGSVFIFETPEEAIAAAIERGASPEKFVGSGLIQDLYGTFLQEEGPAFQ